MTKATTPKTTTRAKRPATAATRKTVKVGPTSAAGAKVPPPDHAVPTASAGAAPKDRAKDDDLMRKPDLIEKVVARSGIKKKDAKPVIEAMLAVLSETLAEGQEMRLPPLGKVMVNRTKKLENGTAYIVKIRQPKKMSDRQSTAPKDPLAKAAD